MESFFDTLKSSYLRSNFYLRSVPRIIFGVWDNEKCLLLSVYSGIVASNHSIHVIGAGFVGLTLTAHLLKTTTSSIMVIDTNESLIRNLRNNIYQVDEPGLHEILFDAAESGRLIFDHIDDFIKGKEVFVCISTPPKENTNPVVTFLSQNFSKLETGAYLYIRSTVHVGTARKAIQLLHSLERFDIQIVSLPERTAEGIALKEIVSLPQLVGSGEGEDRTKLEAKLAQYGFEDLVFEDWSIVELAKLACNVWRDYTFAFGNFMAILGRKMNVNAFKAIEIANYHYPRSSIPRPGFVGGPCLSKDAFILDESFPIEDSLVIRSRRMNLSLEEEVIQDVNSLIKNNSFNQVILVGMAFKGNPKTNDVRESLGMKVLHRTKEAFPWLEIKYWDNNATVPELPRLEDEDINKHLQNTLFVLCNDNQAFIEKLNSLFLEQSLNSAQTLLYDVNGITKGFTHLRSYIFGEGYLEF